MLTKNLANNECGNRLRQGSLSKVLPECQPEPPILDINTLSYLAQTLSADTAWHISRTICIECSFRPRLISIGFRCPAAPAISTICLHMRSNQWT